MARATSKDEIRAALRKILEEMLDDAGFISDADECECGDYGSGWTGPGRTGKPCVHIRGRRILAEKEDHHAK